MLNANKQHSELVVTCSGGLETFLQSEIEAITGQAVERLVGAVKLQASLEHIYLICLWSRVASRVLYTLAEFSYASEAEYYDQLRTIPWHEHFNQEATLAIGVSKDAKSSVNTQYMTYKTKDAVIDHFRDLFNQRPNIDLRDPDIRLQVHFNNDFATVSLDLAGHPLHQRGYRVAQNEAPMKETLAAAVLMSAGWPQQTAPQLIDPMCGSGTLLIEAAMMQANMAPGLLRRGFGFSAWQQHNESLWEATIQAAIKQDLSETIAFSIKGYDADYAAVQAAAKNIRAAGLEGCIHVERRELAQFSVHASAAEKGGTIVCNPPYGERLDQNDQLIYLYRALGRFTQNYCVGWNMAIITNQIEYADALQLQEPITQRVFNGPIKCFLRSGSVVSRNNGFLPMEFHYYNDFDATLPAADFANRIIKNAKLLNKWRDREGICALRLYDSDIPEYNVAVDWYNGHLLVSEYAAPNKVDPEKARRRLEDALKILQQVFRVSEHKIHVKSRQRQKGARQYSKISDQKHFYAINEAGALALVNLDDYLDSGIFLDHRPTRIRLQQLAKGKRFLNLYCYTAMASVHAGLAGAKKTVSVDMSTTYLNWARNNLYLNGLAEANHELIRSDCMSWLKTAHEQFDLIFVDPPTFSNSKRMQGHFDVQASHVELLDLAMKRLEPGGLLIFSNNFKRFKLDEELLARYEVTDITKQSLPQDFGRGKPAHQCWEFRLNKRAE